MVLRATLYGECTIENGRIARNQFRYLQRYCGSAEMPKVETVIVRSYDWLGRRWRTDDFRGGIPAVLNAIHAATGIASAKFAAEEYRIGVGVRDRAGEAWPLRCTSSAPRRCLPREQ